MEPSHESFHVVKRAESIADLVVQLREPLIAIFMDIWTKTYKDEKVTKTKWLQQFQLLLKTVKDLEDDDISDKVSHKKRVLANLYDALMSTAYIHHDTATPHIVKEKPLLFHFVRDCAIHIGRELWAKPYLMYNITHKKTEVASARESLEKLVASAIKYQVRSMTDDIMIIEEERKEKCKDLLSSGPSSVASGDDDMSGIYSPGAMLPAAPAPLTEATLQAAQQHIMINNQPMALVPLASISSAPASVKSLGLPAHSPSPISSHHSSPVSSPPQSVRSFTIGKRCNDEDDDDRDNRDIRSVSSGPRAPSIDHMEYIPLKREADVDRLSIASSAGKTNQKQTRRPSMEQQTKSITVHSIHSHHQHQHHDHNHKRKGDDSSSVSSMPSSTSSSMSSSYSSPSSSSSESHVIVEKKNKISAKPKTSLQKYDYYRQHSAVAALMNKNKQGKQGKKKQTFFK